MTWRDQKGSENASPISKNRPTTGANPPESEDFDYAESGGNKHTSTGGSRDMYSDNPGPVEREAKSNQGIQTPSGPYEDNFSEGDSPGPERSIGASLDKGSID